MPRIAFLGPLGTFTEEALLSQDDLAQGELVPVGSIPEVLAVTERGEVDLGFVAIENAIEGTVNASIDALAFEHDLLIQREIVIPIHQNLLAPPGSTLADIRAVMSIPVATAQVRGWLAANLPGVEEIAANSTAEAARLVGDGGHPGTAAIAPAVAAELYGLDLLATEIEDHPENKTRFVVVAKEGIPAPTGHDKTTIVCFQSFDRPGSLLAILQEFAARAINLTKLESRPTKTSLGQYCFAIDLEGHIAEELVADCLRDIKAKIADVKFLGSYPAAGEHGESRRRDAEVAWRQADEWVQLLRSSIER
ncbi:MAG: prephenate dehydratase [Acidimicrobiales bacterium]|nr:prephenate dehydratase [Acidimicrobiales bacterium]